MGSILFYFVSVFIQHGSTFSAFLPVVKRASLFQHRIGIRIFYFESASYSFCCSCIIQPTIEATITL